MRFRQGADLSFESCKSRLGESVRCDGWHAQITEVHLYTAGILVWKSGAVFKTVISHSNAIRITVLCLLLLLWDIPLNPLNFPFKPLQSDTKFPWIFQFPVTLHRIHEVPTTIIIRNPLKSQGNSHKILVKPLVYHQAYHQFIIKKQFNPT